MAEVEVPSAVEDEQQQLVEAADGNGAASADPEARYRYDDALLIKVKGKVRRPTKPDEQERNLAVDKLKAEIEKRSERIKRIKEMQEASRSARTAGQQGNQEIVRRLQGLRAEFQTVLRQKQHIREELQQAIKQKEELRAASRTLKERLPKGVTADSLEAKIKDLEHSMAHESNADEKGLFKRIQELQNARPAFKELADVEAKLKAVEDKRAEVQHRLQQCDAVLTDVKAREEAERQVLDQSRNRQADGDLDMPALNVEKKECWDIIQVLRAKIDEIRKDFNEKYQEYIKLDKNYNNYMRSVKRKEYEERQKARAEREAAENGTADAEDGAGPGAGGADAVVVEAYASEVLTLDQLVTHLRKLLPSDDKAVAQEEKKEVEVPKGMKLLKKNDEDEGFMTVSKKKPQQGKKGAAPAAAPPPEVPKAAEAPRSKKLNHTLETLKTFMQFAIEVPQTTAELSGTIDKALAKKEYYLELRRTGKKPAPPPAPAAVPEPASAGTSSAAAAQEAASPAEDKPVPPAVVQEEEPQQPEEEPTAAAVIEEVVGKPTVAVVVAASTEERKKDVQVAPVDLAEEGDSKPPANGELGVALAVDKLTESVSIKLSVGSE